MSDSLCLSKLDDHIEKEQIQQDDDVNQMILRVLDEAKTDAL